MAPRERGSQAAVDVVILTWNDGAVLGEAITSALDSEGVDVGVVVVDNGSDPPATPPESDRLTLVRSESNRGVSAGRNLGCTHTTAELVCFLDSDARLEPDCLARLVEALDDDASIALAGPVIVGQPPTASAGRAPTLGRKLLRAAGLTDSYRPPESSSGPYWDVDFTIGACQLFRRQVWKATGGLDETYFYGPEDVDFCLRLRAAGHRVVQVGAARCHHPARRRFRNPFTRRGLQHGAMILRHLWRHRRRAAPR